MSSAGFEMAQMGVARRTQRVFENSAQLLIQNDVPPIFWFLQIVCFDVLPDALDYLQSRECAYNVIL